MNLQDSLQSAESNAKKKWDRYSVAMIGAGVIAFPLGEPTVSAGALIAAGLFSVASALCSTKNEL